jgi:hypothetical protein
MAAPGRVLTRRDLNRTLLARQFLLERASTSVVKAVGHLGGLQAQSTPSPYLSLWARLDGFERDDLSEALKSRRLVKALLQRGTLHVVTPRQYWTIMAVRQELADPRRHRALADRDEERPRARDHPRRRVRRGHLAARRRARAARALREARRSDEARIEG